MPAKNDAYPTGAEELVRLLDKREPMPLAYQIASQLSDEPSRLKLAEVLAVRRLIDELKSRYEIE